MAVRNREQSYGEHLEILLALITYFGLTGWRSRAPNGLARDLGLDEERITATLAGFPGLFRRSFSRYDTEAGQQHAYTLHARYALRRPRPRVDPNEDLSAQDGRGEELDVETLRALLDFVSDQARAERDSHHQQRSQHWVAIGVVVAAAASLVAAVIQVFAK